MGLSGIMENIMLAAGTNKGVVGFLAFLASAFGNWERTRKSRRQDRHRFRDVSAHEVARMARDVGVSSFDLYEMVRLGPDAGQLARRMAALHIDSDKVSRTDMPLVRDMQRLCAMCRHKSRCDIHLIIDPENAVWRQYCPNERFLAEPENVGGL